MPINPKSSWPFTPYVLQNVLQIEKAPKNQKRGFVVKTVERFFRAGAKIMEHYGMPADQALTIAREQILREGGAKAKAQLQAHDKGQADKVLGYVDASEALVENMLNQIKNGEEPN